MEKGAKLRGFAPWLWLLAAIWFGLGGGYSAAAAGEEFAPWLAALRVEAAGEGISESTLDAALTGLAPLPRVLALERERSEPEKGLDEYLQLAVSERQAKKGWFKLQGNSPLLRGLGRRYGVDAAVLVALWGIESNYGLLQGDFPLFASLAALAHDSGRSAYFRAELLAALHLLEEGRLELGKMQGSSGGGMGGLQLMPSVIREWAVDEDGDGTLDIWRSLPDMFATAANFLGKSGWKMGLGWGLEVRLPPGFDRNLAGADKQRPVSKWLQSGLARVKKEPLTGPDPLATLLLPDPNSERAFLVFANYEILLKWNRNHYRALAAGLLADQIGAM